MKIKEGEKLPYSKVFILEKEHKEISTKEILNKNKVILFGLPGAFTPICSTLQLPSFEQQYSNFQSFGINRIYCVSVNDSLN